MYFKLIIFKHFRLLVETILEIGRENQEKSIKIISTQNLEYKTKKDGQQEQFYSLNAVDVLYSILST